MLALDICIVLGVGCILMLGLICNLAGLLVSYILSASHIKSYLHMVPYPLFIYLADLIASSILKICSAAIGSCPKS